MRRADRLFEIIQLMRRKAPVRARDLSEALEVSERTIYRDIQDLIASGVPIEGEAGVGYVLKAGFDLPPLMFKEQEIEALVLGARIVESLPDAELAEAASNAIAKIEAVIPDRLRGYMANTALLAPPHTYMEPIRFDMARLRGALRSQLKVHFRYTDYAGRQTVRTVRPLSLAYFGPIWLLAAWWLPSKLDINPLSFRVEPGKTLQEFLKRDQTWNRRSEPVPSLEAGTG